MRATVTTRHPSEELAVINDKVGKGELMRIEEERCDTETKDSHPEVDNVGDEDRHGDVEQENQGAYSEIDRWSGETRTTRQYNLQPARKDGYSLENAKRDTCRCETSASGYISSTSEGQIVEDRMHVDLCREHLKDGRKREEVLGESKKSSAGTTFGEFWQSARVQPRLVKSERTLDEEGHKGDPDDKPDRDNTSLDPREDGSQVVTSRLSGKDIAIRVVSTNTQLTVERTKEDQSQHDDLYRQHDELACQLSDTRAGYKQLTMLLMWKPG
jgi:hypothetical protein